MGGNSSIGGGSPIVLFEPSKEPLSFAISSSPNQNPDQNGRASPLQLRIYQLADDTLFKNADFYSLFDKDTQILGRYLKKKEQMTIQPGQKNQPQPMILDRKTLFIGVLGAFQDLDNAVSTLLIPIDPDEPAPMCLRIEEKSLVIASTCE
jgi:type VI secretion system protein VasD